MLPAGRDVRVQLVIHCPWKEKWLEVWIYMDPWAATWKEHDWKIRDKDIGVDEEGPVGGSEHKACSS